MYMTLHPVCMCVYTRLYCTVCADWHTYLADSAPGLFLYREREDSHRFSDFNAVLHFHSGQEDTF